MYRKSFFLVLLSLMVMGLLVTGSRIVSAVPGFAGMPSSYDPHISVEEAVKTSTKPLLIEFYTDNCATCQVITPWMHKLGKKYADRLTFVMVDVNDSRQGQIADIFGIQYVPAIFVFDFKHMSKAQVDIAAYKTMSHLDKAIEQAITRVNAKAQRKSKASL